jgi:hypothetical protein
VFCSNGMIRGALLKANRGLHSANCVSLFAKLIPSGLENLKELGLMFRALHHEDF